ncbi:hypothetical protein OSB04_011536 [Centaurea solstitialis]|uniref:Uncharacterized protein n=1 Tax=Centaurea solstitialis TaxID=347529 RepID=A0AA38WDS3_9ASTR|nr:hypothetical protein OSB04_011536 [Centaurea solstitialis]
MLYGKACHLPFEFEHKALWALKKVYLDDITTGRERLINLHELEELRSLAYENSKIYKEQCKKWHDAQLKKIKVFKEGDKVLLYQTRFKFSPGKLRSRWVGPFVVLKAHPSGYVDLITERGQFRVNGQRQRTRSSTSTARNFRAPDGSHAFTFFMNDPTLNAPKREQYRDTVNRLLTRQVLVPRRHSKSTPTTKMAASIIFAMHGNESSTLPRPSTASLSLSSWPRFAILGDGNYGGNLKVKGFLASSGRLLHRMLIHAVNARSSSEEKVSSYDLWLLEQLSTDDKYPNAPYLIAVQLAKASGYREESRLVGGQYVTLLAKHFGILTDGAIASMTDLGEMGLIDMDQLRGMGVALVDHLISGDQNTWIHNPQAYGTRRAPRSTREFEPNCYSFCEEYRL